MVNGSPFSSAQLKKLRKLVEKETTSLINSQKHITSLPTTIQTPQVVIDERQRQFDRQAKRITKLMKINEVVRKELAPKCVDCGVEEPNPGLDVCGYCYDKSIRG